MNTAVLIAGMYLKFCAHITVKATPPPVPSARARKHIDSSRALLLSAVAMVNLAMAATGRNKNAELITVDAAMFMHKVVYTPPVRRQRP